MSTDVVIVGGGVMGAATACFLARDHGLSVTVLERDPLYRRASSALSASSIRQQFSTPVNIALSAWSVAFLRRLEDELSVEGEPPPAIGLVGVVAGALDAAGGAGDTAVSLLRVVIGTFFLGAVSDAMLLGHWYLVQPGLPRKILNELVVTVRWLLPFQVAAMLLPTGMFSVFGGSVDDGWGGMLGWFWLACAVTTAVLIEVTIRALKERSYSAVMAATGLMYLAILTAFGTDLVARAVLA